MVSSPKSKRPGVRATVYMSQKMWLMCRHIAKRTGFDVDADDVTPIAVVQHILSDTVDRFIDTYGLSDEAIGRIIHQDPDLNSTGAEFRNKIGKG